MDHRRGDADGCFQSGCDVCEAEEVLFDNGKVRGQLTVGFEGGDVARG